VGGVAALVVVAAVVVPVTVTAGSGPVPVAGHPAAASGRTTTTTGKAGRATSSTTGGRAPTVAPPPSTTTTTLPVSAAGTHGLARAIQPGEALPAVPPLKAVREVDAIVQLPTTITPDEVQSLTHLPGITAVEEVDIGTVQLAGTSLVAVGVDPGTFRQFTPQVTAAQDQLWSYVAAGALVADYGSAADHQLSAGQAISLTPAGGKLPPAVGWLGALASLGLPGIDLVVDHTYAAALGLTSSNGLLVSAPGVDPYGLQASLAGALHGAGVELVRAPTPGT
jgi:hypothetical protein